MGQLEMGMADYKGVSHVNVFFGVVEAMADGMWCVWCEEAYVFRG